MMNCKFYREDDLIDTWEITSFQQEKSNIILNLNLKKSDEFLDSDVFKDKIYLILGKTIILNDFLDDFDEFIRKSSLQSVVEGEKLFDRIEITENENLLFSYNSSSDERLKLLESLQNQYPQQISLISKKLSKFCYLLVFLSIISIIFISSFRSIHGLWLTGVVIVLIFYYTKRNEINSYFIALKTKIKKISITVSMIGIIGISIYGANFFYQDSFYKISNHISPSVSTRFGYDLTPNQISSIILKAVIHNRIIVMFL